MGAAAKAGDNSQFTRLHGRLVGLRNVAGLIGRPFSYRTMTKESQDTLSRWGKLLALVIALVTLTAAARAVLDDRYVRHSALDEMKGDIRVIRAVLCGDRPAGCQ